MMGGAIPRPFPGHEGAGRALDRRARPRVGVRLHPLWEKCVELGVSPTFHSTGAGWGTRTSPTNYVFNHIGNFAAAGELTARSLFFGGVPMRFPQLRFAFLEGGAAWACNLLSDLLGHWEKRNRDAIGQYDPAALDRDQLGGAVRARTPKVGCATGSTGSPTGLGMLSEPIVGDDVVDEFAESLVQRPEDIVDIFTVALLLRLRGRRPDDRARVRPRAQPARRAAAGDVRERHRPLGRARLRDVLPEAWELVEHGHLDPADFRAFTFDNPVALWTGTNPNFFAGTRVESAVS